MKSIFKNWEGIIEVDKDDDEKYTFDDFNPEDGEMFHVKLIPVSRNVSQDKEIS